MSSRWDEEHPKATAAGGAPLKAGGGSVATLKKALSALLIAPIGEMRRAILEGRKRSRSARATATTRLAGR
uniref:Uncharacterized protein n=1 Tax=candidate division WWE3 bacterium TaxID=2053526 RepID=A0A831YYG5_UNCKA